MKDVVELIFKIIGHQTGLKLFIFEKVSDVSLFRRFVDDKITDKGQNKDCDDQQFEHNIITFRVHFVFSLIRHKHQSSVKS